jgi:glycosyltransferase involved in cell wall biosynthesis
MVLFTELFVDNKDNIEFVKKNLSSQFIKKVVVFVDDYTESLIFHSKIIKIKKRFRDPSQIFEFAKSFVNSDICVISNSYLSELPIQFLGLDFNSKVYHFDNQHYVFKTGQVEKFRNIVNLDSNQKLFSSKNQTQNFINTDISDKMDVIIISVDYNDYLSITLKNNLRFVQNIHVVTSSKDLDCQQICSDYGVDCIITDTFYESNSPFNKGKAINYAISKLKNPSWILILDADILLNGPINVNSLEFNTLYSCKRMIVENYEQYLNLENQEFIEENGIGYGYFQLFNFSSKYIDRKMVYPEVSRNASKSDVIFKKRFKTIKDMNFKVHHLGGTRINWNGRKSEIFEIKENIKKINSNFTIATTYFNPFNDINVKNNFLKFINQFEFCKENLVVGFVDYDNINFDIDVKKIVIPGDIDNIIWYKEILLNKILDVCQTDYFIWVDADVIFDKYEWLYDIDKYMFDKDFCQLFSEVIYLNEHQETDMIRPSFISKIKEGVKFDSALKNGLTPGLAWMGHTKILKKFGFFEKMKVGGGDTVFANAILKSDSDFIKSIFTINKSTYNEIIGWSTSVGKMRVGFYDQRVHHLWHGKMSKRKYSERNSLLSDNSSKDQIKNYFKERVSQNYNPLVSVIIVNYNCDEYIEKSVESVLNQSYQNFELLIVDNNSNDDSIQRISKYLSDRRVSIYKIEKNVGPYWAKNSAIQKCNGDLITMLDSDDFDHPNKLESQVLEFAKNKDILVVSCSYQRIGEKPSFGWPSMMFSRTVYEQIGFYDSVMFGGDSEFFDRFLKFYGKNKAKHLPIVLQSGVRRENSLTTIVPERSKIREKYINRYKKWHDDAKKLFIEYPPTQRKFSIPERMMIKDKINLYNIHKLNSDSDLIPIIMCTWRRLDGFRQIVHQLNSQNFKKFKLFVWNNNIELSMQFENELKEADFQYEIHHSEKNIGGFGRFYYASKIRRKPGFIDFCIFIDDDQTFGDNLVETLFSEKRPYTISSQWGWRFNGTNYYTNRVNVDPGGEIHYAGTGGMISDMRVFEDDYLFNCPEEFWFVEDLWLSYYATHVHGYKLLKSSAKMKNGDDDHSLYKIVKDLKTPMLNYLIEKNNWNIFIH